tara:strand:- start:393 stop:599 length:207 start_codon:yes stop_codon:yes gene_type:complete
MRYMVYWKKMLTKDQGDAPMRDFDTTIEAKAYIRGCVDIIVTFDKKQKKSEIDLLNEFKIEKIEKGRI